MSVGIMTGADICHTPQNNKQIIKPYKNDDMKNTSVYLLVA